MVMPATLRSMLNAPTRGHDFGPDDSTILSSLYHPQIAARKLADFLQNNIETAAGLNSGYDNPNPLLGPSDESRVNAALTLAGLMQTGSMPFGPVSKGGTLGSIPVWHGSPHKFDEFSLKNIGTGEGAQAYGHGLYFSESPKVADEYAGKLSDPIVEIAGISNFNHASKDALKAYKNLNETAKRTQYMGRGDAVQSQLLNIQRHHPEIAKELGFVDFWKTPVHVYDSGNLYKVSLEWPDAAREAADPLGPQHFLDWDKPLSEQPQIAQYLPSHLSKSNDIVGAFMKRAQTNQLFAGDMIGADRTTFPELSTELARRGIPGLRYLDQGSRGSGQGTYNYVVFDDKIPRIVERNGISLRELLGKK